MTPALFHQWADRFGLATVPFFRTEQEPGGARHSVLLDGGYGSFALSETDEELWRSAPTADWAWSSNLPHHITVTKNVVAVRRWDKPEPELLTRKSVDSKLETFYEYLASDRVRSNQSVIEHVLAIFRRVRSLVAEAGISDEQSVDVFLELLSRAIAREEQSAPHAPLTSSSDDLIGRLSRSGVETLLKDAFAASSSFRLFPSLAVRHAGSGIFQEAHFALLRASETDLFGYAAPAVSRPVTRGGAHFTPASLARTVVEQVLTQMDVARRRRLVVTDPACGSGAFLHEAMRTLRRLGFQGQLVLVGRDISRPAISMAEFVIRQATSEWQPAGGLQVDLQAGNSLTSTLPISDVTLMNPPFISWSMLDAEQRDQMKTILGERLQGRGDLSMAFTTRAIEALAPGGALGVLFPTSLLTLQAAENWRNDLLARTDMRLLASLGDYGLFTHALVQVAAAVFVRPAEREERSNTTLALVSSNTPEATGSALRMLRRHHGQPNVEGDQSEWRLFEIPSERFRDRPTWRIMSPQIDRALARLSDRGMPRISDIFDVKQGVRTGKNQVFVINQEQYMALSTREQKYFRPALVNDSIQDGRILSGSWVFYPYGDGKPAFDSEEELKKAVPKFAKQVLYPNKEVLERRSSITRSGRLDWWGLSEPRATWAMETAPRIVSKYFGGPGCFALDLEARNVIIQGYAWRLKNERTAAEEAPSMDVRDLLRAYASLMNSRTFGKILALFSSHVAGGQFDLSPRYVNAVPLPDLMDLAGDERVGRIVTELAKFDRAGRAQSDWGSQAEQLTVELYGRELTSLL